jgi:N-acetylmuramoyl-L-alanine amidase
MAQTHKVRRGDCLASIAKQYGFTDWKKIYEAAENAELRRKRPNPNVLYPGDLVVIPAKSEKWVPAATTNRHIFHVKGPSTVLRLVMKDRSLKPLGGKAFELFVDGSLLESGTSQADGLIEVRIPEDARRGVLRFLGNDYPLDLGALDPISRVTGVQQRLNNLGYQAGAEDGVVGPKTRLAVARFQSDQELEVTGVIDDATRAKLLEIHDRDNQLLECEEDMNPEGEGDGEDSMGDEDERAPESGDDCFPPDVRISDDREP